MQSGSLVRRGTRACLAALALGAVVSPAALAAPGNGATVSATPIAFELYDACAGEFVAVSGTIHTVANDGGGADVFHQNFSGATGVGETSGTVYTITGSAHQRFSADSDDSRQSVRENFVTRGSAPNHAIGLVVDVTVGQDGQVTSVDRSFDECRG